MTDDVICPRTDRPLRLDNTTCPYCGILLTPDTATKEHVVARNFVPKGALENCWNLHLMACRSCNTKKSDLEDDISAISLFPTLTHGVVEGAEADALRKARARSRRTGKAVALSAESIEHTIRFGPAEMTFSFTGPPQLSESRAFALARFHVQAFFYYVTYDRGLRRGRHPTDTIMPIMCIPRSDWGNETACAFMTTTRSWDLRFHGTTADGFFRVALRKQIQRNCFSWAFEWNKTYRVVGVVGLEAALLDFAAALPRLRTESAMDANGTLNLYRFEQPLPDADDTLFDE